MPSNLMNIYILWIFVLAVLASPDASRISRTDATKRPFRQNAFSTNIPDNSTFTPTANLDIHGSSNSNPNCNSGLNQIEYRLTRLEVLLTEKTDNLRMEVRETTRRLQNLEWQVTETQSTVEAVRAEFPRLTQSSPAQFSGISQTSSLRMEEKLDSVSKAVQTAIVSLKILTSDIRSLQENITTVVNVTDSILNENEQLVNKQFFTHGLMELKHHQMPSGGYPSCPEQKSVSSLPKNCKEVFEAGNNLSGIYKVQPEHAQKPFLAFCDMETRGGGWTVIHRRFNGLQDFYQNWRDYKHGFGNLGAEFWLGLENVFLLTGTEMNELLVELQDLNSVTKTAHYKAFSIGPEIEGYALKVLGGFDGDAGDSLIYHAGGRFSTKDMDQDDWKEGSCAQAHNGGWWYRSCDNSNLNGEYLKGEVDEDHIYKGMYWSEFNGPQYSLKRARMLIRPHDNSRQSAIDQLFKIPNKTKH